MNLVIIEGAGKKETIEKYLGDNYCVFATKGHVRDLPVKKIGVDIKDNFKPEYVVSSDKRPTVKDIKALSKKSDQIYLATDPDREGEAISWHIAQILELDPNNENRIVFNEISKRAILKALENPRKIDLNLVNAQQARRVFDRLVGYKISPILCKKIQNNLSAGRVQSVTLKLIVDREKEIINFKPEEYWNFFSILDSKGNNIKAAIYLYKDEKIKLTSREMVDKVIKDIDGKDYIVKSVKKTVTSSNPPAPFITSTMQQDALNKLNMSLAQTTRIAQTLYEGVDIPSEGKVALVTYIRTDSTRISDEAQAEAKEYIINNFGKDYVPEVFNVYKSKKQANVQDAHEAIRPISLDRKPENLKNVLKLQEYKLYKLIYERFLASQMSKAKYNSQTVEIKCEDYTFKITGRTPLFEGYTKIYKLYSETEENTDKQTLPELKEGEKLNFIEYNYEQKFTKPPARYTEASIVKTMEEKGIGRPATYNPTVQILFKRMYVEKENKSIKPTELGFKVVEVMEKFFADIMNMEFTANMEDKLDSIEEGDKIWQDIVGEYYKGIEQEIINAKNDEFTLKEPDEPTDKPCPKCGALLVKKTGRYGKFLACPNFPKCKYTESAETENSNDEYTVGKKTDIKCDKCGGAMVVKVSKYGKFLSCENYPDCKNVMPIQENDNELGLCPECHSKLHKINFRGSVFYGCTNYPNCKFNSKFKVLKDTCPKCGGYTILTTINKDNKKIKCIKCANKECNHVLKEIIDEDQSINNEDSSNKNEKINEN